MNTCTRSTLAFLTATLLFGAAAFAQPATAPATQPVANATLDGAWAGEIAIPDNSLGVLVRFRNVNGEWRGVIDIPQQNARDLPLKGISVGDVISFTIAQAPGAPTFRGRIEGDFLKGEFTQGAARFPFTLRKGRLTPVARPQDPAAPFPYREEEVAIDVVPGVRLAGTLTLPQGAGPFPAVVLLTGSGPQNRDEEIAGHRPFRLLADRLTRAGIATLRCDDRGVSESTGLFASAALPDFARDADAQLSFLRSRPDIRAGAVGLLGHSEGGVVAARVAAERPGDVAFVVLMASPALTGRQVLARQLEQMLVASEVQPGLIRRQLEAQGKLLDAVQKDDEAAATTALVELMVAQRGVVEPSPQLTQQLTTEARDNLPAMKSSWFRTMLTHDPATDFARITAPVLAINGARDLQVDSGLNLAQLKKSLTASRDVTTLELPGLNHLFQPATTGLPAEYGRIPTTIDESVLTLIPTWVYKRVGNPAATTTPAR